jgi:hypothetical protein
VEKIAVSFATDGVTAAAYVHFSAQANFAGRAIYRGESYFASRSSFALLKTSASIVGALIKADAVIIQKA